MDKILCKNCNSVLILKPYKLDHATVRFYYDDYDCIKEHIHDPSIRTDRLYCRNCSYRGRITFQNKCENCDFGFIKKCLIAIAISVMIVLKL